MKQGFVVSLVLNVLLVCVVVFIGIHTSFFINVVERLGWIEKKIVLNQKADDCLRGWTKSLESLHDTVDVVFLGNSITHGGDFDSAFPNLKICNLGFPSDDLKGMRKRVPQVKALNPRVVFIMGGLNGLYYMGLKDLRIQYDVLIKELISVGPETQFVLQSVLPVNEKVFGHPLCPNHKIERANDIIKELAAYYDLHYVDLYTPYLKEGNLNNEYTYDGVHLKSGAYQIWYKEIQSFLN